MDDGNLRCPHCHHWLGEVQRGSSIRLRLRCTHCKRQWVVNIKEELAPDFQPVQHRVLCRDETVQAMEVLMCPATCAARTVSAKCVGQRVTSA